MKLSKKKIALAVAVAMAIVLPFMLFGGDTQTGSATTFANYGHGHGGVMGVPIVPDPWHCQYFNWGC